MFKKYLCLILSFLIIGCSSSLFKSKYPEWYVKRPRNDDEYLYGVGEGYEMESAEKMALKHISEQILVTLSSESSIYKAETKAEYVEEAEYEISEKSEAITFTNYEVVKSEANKEDFFVLVRVDKHELIKNQVDELEQIDAKIDALDKKSKRRTSLERVVALQNIDKLSREAEIKIKVIKSLQPMFDEEIYSTKYSNYYHEYTDKLNNMVFYIKTNDSFDKQVGEVFKKHLNQNNIKVVETFGVDKTILDIYSDVFTKKIYEAYNTKGKVRTALLVRGMTIKTNLIDIKGVSAISSAEAKKNAIKNLDETLEKEGLFKVLGLEK